MAKSYLWSVGDRRQLSWRWDEACSLCGQSFFMAGRRPTARNPLINSHILGSIYKKEDLKAHDTCLWVCPLHYNIITLTLSTGLLLVRICINAMIFRRMKTSTGSECPMSSNVWSLTRRRNVSSVSVSVTHCRCHHNTVVSQVTEQLQSVPT